MTIENKRSPVKRNGCRDAPYDFLTVEEWRERFRKEEITGKSGQWLIPLAREIFSSDAYIEGLSLADAHILNCFLNKLRYEPRNTTEARNFVKRTGRKKGGKLLNANNLVLTNNEIIARGKVRGARQIAAARRNLVRIGFLDVVTPGRFPHPTIFGWSDRWRRYPHPDHLPNEDIPVSFAPYPHIEKFNRERGGK